MYFLSNAKEYVSILRDKSAYNDHVQSIRAIKRELGARNFEVLENVYKASPIEQRHALATIENGKKCTFDRFNTLCDAYKQAMDYRSKIQFTRQALSDISTNDRSKCTLFSWHASLDSPKYKNKNLRDSLINSGFGAGIHLANEKRMDLISEVLKREAIPKCSGFLHLTVKRVSDLALVDYSSTTTKGFLYNHGTDMRVTVALPTTWYSRVYKRKLTQIDGLFNLDVSTPLHHDFGNGIYVFAAIWLANGSGTKKKVVRGFIAKKDDFAFHGKSLNAAVRGLIKKLEANS